MTFQFDENHLTLPPLHKGSYYLTKPRKPWLVSGIIREGTTVFLSGKEGTGKSILALELAACVSEGRSFFGNKVSRGEVVYVAAERGEAQRERIEALRDAKGVHPDAIAFFDHQFKLNNRPQQDLLIEAISAADCFPKLIVIDTLRASFEGDENSSAVAQQVMDGFARIKRHFNCTIVVLHHVNAFGQSRGSSAFIGAADTELYVTNSKKTGRAFFKQYEKQNNGRTWLKYVLTPQVLEFGEDYSSIVFNLVGTEELDAAPASDDEESVKDQAVVALLKQYDKPVTHYRIHQDLPTVEGYQRNKDSLTKDLSRLGKEFRINVIESNGKLLYASNDLETDK